ncbi:NAD(P)/FAD-dependent oxidoreductase [Burkholderia pseudomultivorans]|uniref:Gamma-glutamylputrescine oxidoreductase n=1 Tax=Burkholderia pseudomultivorans TaxID=1207504 RepID=A0ABU2E083_9BURK|nr:FAD-binding oxidoreductase [Burkholderia pseudomultivorans]MDR8726836.1 Gamma-glutamylputrescine oxidoreductase [Burkholderia pseudomultivorans]MDR8736059.1 Gamma-glutamylputrescine oxidoreductase [Burkholderia pseudomultivorans]MDR8742035.1 Gamma-glutamylputrescine oxidoreductase [Burkholderia pseudomultivorans]MDR8753166.1 Gamma-glutamylputrescine oxidoreductase [Burkholderia pseudomultivorans]MDR8778629.1 Gamma-glutamylputrescine oxidoreductase [Burkholderia pseudomultivorans]
MQKVTSLPADDRMCGWYHTSPPRLPRPSHAGESTARWAVVGAGFTGLAAARQLALNFPDDEIILVDAQEVGYGTSGRNAGFAIDLPHDIGADDYIGDIPTARNTLKLNLLGQTILRNLVSTHRIDCQLHASGKYQAAVAERGVAVLDAYRRGLDKLGQAYEVIDGKDLPAHIGTSFYRKGLFTPGTVLVQPSALVKGLADCLPPNVTLYENTPITGVDYGDKVVLAHRNGRITVDKLVLANNAFGMRFGFLERTMLPVFLYASLTRPLSTAEQARLGGKPFWGVIPADPFGSTLRRTHDNRILVRNSFSFNPDGRPREAYLPRFVQRHRLSFERRFPMLPDVEFEYTWSGSLALSHNHKGFFGQLAPNVYGALCCNGLGITRGTVTGTLLADWLAGKRSDLTDFLLATSGPNRNPPEPFLSIGVNATLWWGQRKAGLES